VIALRVTLGDVHGCCTRPSRTWACRPIAGNCPAGQDTPPCLTSYLVSKLHRSHRLRAVFPSLTSGEAVFLLDVRGEFLTVSFVFFFVGLAPSPGRPWGFRIFRHRRRRFSAGEHAILNDNFPLDKRGAAFAVSRGLAVVVAPTIGPWLVLDSPTIFFLEMDFLHQRTGGWLFRSLLTNFFGNDPPYTEKAVESGFRIDYIGIGLSSAWSGSMQIYSWTSVQREDWLSSNFIRVFGPTMLVGNSPRILWNCAKRTGHRLAYC